MTRGEPTRRAACALALLLVFPASASGAPRSSLRLEGRTSSRANSFGWWREPVTGSIEVAGIGGRRLLDECRSSTVTTTRAGIASRYARARRAPASTCTSAGRASSESIVEHSLRVTLAGRVVTRTLVLRVDGVPPEVRMTAPASPQTGTLRVQGTASDGWSGPREVLVELESAAQRFTFTARCDSCGTYTPCAYGRRTTCGATVAWEMTEDVPSGLYHVTPIVTDLGGNQVRGTPADVIVVRA